MNAVVLAAGRGTRLLPLTRDKPKALVELGAKPLIEYVYESLAQAGVNEVVTVIGEKGDMIESFFGNRFDSLKLSYVTQEKPLGTGHALLCAKQQVKGDFLMAQCDVLCPSSTWKALLAAKEFDAVLTLRHEAAPEQFGVVLTQGGLVADIIEKPDTPPSNLVNAGCYRFSPAIFNELQTLLPSKRGEIELTDALRKLAARSRAGFYLEKEKIWDIGSIETLSTAAEFFGEREIKW